MRLRSPHDREIFRLALPALGALAAEPLYVLADTAIVGHLGGPQIAALGLAGAVFALDGDPDRRERHPLPDVVDAGGERRVRPDRRAFARLGWG